MHTSSIKRAKAWTRSLRGSRRICLRSHAWITVDDLKYLKRGGRISTLAATMGTMLDLKPIIALTREGTMTSTDKVRGPQGGAALFGGQDRREHRKPRGAGAGHYPCRCPRRTPTGWRRSSANVCPNIGGVSQYFVGPVNRRALRPGHRRQLLYGQGSPPTRLFEPPGAKDEVNFEKPCLLKDEPPDRRKSFAAGAVFFADCARLRMPVCIGGKTAPRGCGPARRGTGGKHSAAISEWVDRPRPSRGCTPRYCPEGMPSLTGRG